MKRLLRWLAIPLLDRYLAAMHVKKLDAAGLITGEGRPYFLAVVRRAVILDLIYNLTWATIYFRDWPREMLVTQRLERYKYGRAYRIVRTGWEFGIEEISVPLATDWRLDQTHWLEINLLNGPDPSGAHLRPPK